MVMIIAGIATRFVACRGVHRLLNSGKKIPGQICMNAAQMVRQTNKRWDGVEEVMQLAD